MLNLGSSLMEHTDPTQISIIQKSRSFKPSENIKWKNNKCLFRILNPAPWLTLWILIAQTAPYYFIIENYQLSHCECISVKQNISTRESFLGYYHPPSSSPSCASSSSSSSGASWSSLSYPSRYTSCVNSSNTDSLYVLRFVTSQLNKSNVLRFSNDFYNDTSMRQRLKVGT